MKSKKSIILSLVLVTTTLLTSSVFGEDKYKIDLELGNKYKFVAPFSEGRALVGFIDDNIKNPLPSNLGYIDEKGEEVIPVQYLEAGDFNNGVALVKEKGVHSYDGHNGFIDKNGNTVVPFKYYYLKNCSDGRIAFLDNESWGFLDINGNIVIKNVYDYVSDFENGLSSVSKDGKWGLIDTTGKTVIPIEYDYLSEASDLRTENDLFHASIGDKYGLINKNNEIITPIKYHSVNYIGENLAEVGIRNIDENDENIWEYGIVNSKGEEIVPIKYESCEYFKNGLIALKENGKYGLINKYENIVMPFEYDNIRYLEDKSGSGEYVIVCYNFEDSTVSYLNKNSQIIKSEYNLYSSELSEGLMVIEEHEKKGYVDTDFNILIEPMFDSALDFSEGLAIVGNLVDESGKTLYGYIDKTGEFIVPMIYDSASNFENGQAIVKKDGNYYFISLDDGSNEVTPSNSDVPKVILNGELLEFPTDPVIIDGTTYVPIRKIAEGLGATVRFEPNTKNTLVELSGKVLSFNKNNNSIIKDSTMLIPVRYVSESFGAEVSWEQATKTVIINQKYDVLLNNLNDEVFLYASSSEADDGMYDSILVKTKDKENVFKWNNTINPTFYPTIEYFDNDKIFIRTTFGSGTGVRLENAHILNKNTLEEYEIEDPIKILDENITINENEIIDGKTYVSIDTPNDNFKYEFEPVSNSFNKAHYGSIVIFNIVDNTLVSTIGIQYSPAGFIDNSVYLYYKFDGEKYVYDNIVLSLE